MPNRLGAQLRQVPENIDGAEDGRIKSLLLAIPGRIAPMVENATVEQVRGLIAEEIEQTIAVLDQD